MEKEELEQEELLEEELKVEEDFLKKERKKIKFDFTKKEYDYFCEQCMFSKLQEDILNDKIRDLSIVEMSMKYNLSEETIKKNIKKIKNKILKVI